MTFGMWVGMGGDGWGWVGIREMENENALLTRALVEESQLAERRHKGGEWTVCCGGSQYTEHGVGALAWRSGIRIAKY